MIGDLIDFDAVRKRRVRHSQVIGFMEKQPARVIAITSGKGGVGKTTTAVNLALALVQAGKKVLVLDADLGLANVNIMLGFEPRMTLREVIAQRATIDDVIVSLPSGLDIIPASSGFPELTNLSEGERMLLVSAFDDLAYRYDYMLVDTAAGIGDNVLYFNEAAEDVLVVIDSEPTSLTDAYALIKVLAAQHGVKSFQILVNRVPKGVDGKQVFAQIAAATGKFLSVRLQYLGSIGHDEEVSKAIISQRAFYELFPSSKTGLDFAKLAKRLIAEPRQASPRGGLQFFFRALLEGGKGRVSSQ